MTRLLIAAFSIFALQSLRAEEAPTQAQDPVAQSQEKSFFESHSLEDVQRLVNVEGQFNSEGATGSTDLTVNPSGAGAG